MLEQKYTTVGVASDEEKLKLAAIFYDKVIPLKAKIKVPRELVYGSKDTRDTILKTFDEQSDFFNKYNLSSDMQKLAEIIVPILFKKQFAEEIELTDDEMVKLLAVSATDHLNSFFNTVVIQVSKRIQKGNLISIPILNESILFDYLKEDYLKNDITNKVELTFINAPIISSKELEWSQILEAKKDGEFVSKANRFGVFINKNYKDKDINFIIDDLSIQIEDYKTACSKHGINLVQGTFKSLLNSKSLFGTMGLVLCSILFKSPEFALISGGIGGVLELLNVGLTIRQYEDEFQSFIKECPISLIFELEKLKSRNRIVK